MLRYWSKNLKSVSSYLKNTSPYGKIGVSVSGWEKLNRANLKYEIKNINKVKIMLPTKNINKIFVNKKID